MNKFRSLVKLNFVINSFCFATYVCLARKINPEQADLETKDISIHINVRSFAPIDNSIILTFDRNLTEIQKHKKKQKKMLDLPI